MGSKCDVIVPDVLMARCARFGHALVEAYARGDCPPSCAVSSHGAATNPRLQAQSKAGEVAFALYRHLDPLAAVKWDIGWADRGFDVCDRLGFRTDVKTIDGGKHFLLWPVRKRELFAAKRFDLLALVKAEGSRFTICGWLPKDDFARLKNVARCGDGTSLTPGTWYVHENELLDFEWLPFFALRYGEDDHDRSA